MRIGIIRESMPFAGREDGSADFDRGGKEIKTILGGKLGATLVESSDPLWTEIPISSR